MFTREEAERIDKAVVSNPRTYHLARILEVPHSQAVGLLIMTLGWGEIHIPSGLAPRLPREIIDAVIGFKGFAAGLVEVGWLDGAKPGIRFARLGPWSPEWLARKRKARRKAGRARKSSPK